MVFSERSERFATITLGSSGPPGIGGATAPLEAPEGEERVPFFDLEVPGVEFPEVEDEEVRNGFVK
jgi:hypothetical protein